MSTASYSKRTSQSENKRYKDDHFLWHVRKSNGHKRSQEQSHEDYRRNKNQAWKKKLTKVKSTKVFQAGNIKNYYDNWTEITNGITILEIVRHGLEINFKNAEDEKHKPPFENKMTTKDSNVISEEIVKLLNKKVIEKTTVNPDHFFSSLFVRLKKDDGISYRTILNLKRLNTECQTQHFKLKL